MSDDPKPKPATKGVIYIGNGATLPDVPARDLSADDMAALLDSPPEAMTTVTQLRVWLVKTGLYKEA